MRKTLLAAGAALLLGIGLVFMMQPESKAQEGMAAAQQEGLSLITATPEEGFDLAVTLSRRGVTTTQTDREVLHALRPDYAHNADALIASSHVIAVHFQTVAAANDYWR